MENNVGSIVSDNNAAILNIIHIKIYIYIYIKANLKQIRQSVRKRAGSTGSERGTVVGPLSIRNEAEQQTNFP